MGPSPPKAVWPADHYQWPINTANGLDQDHEGTARRDGVTCRNCQRGYAHAVDTIHAAAGPDQDHEVTEGKPR